METAIAIIGALGGTILGWILNELSKRGKIRFSIDDVQFDFKLYSFWKCDYNIKARIGIINSSSDARSIINLEFVIRKGFMKASIPVAEEILSKPTKISFGTGKDKSVVEYINCDPHKFEYYNFTASGFHIHLSGDNPEILKYFKNYSLIMIYINEKNKRKRINMCKITEDRIESIKMQLNDEKQRMGDTFSQFVDDDETMSTQQKGIII